MVAVDPFVSVILGVWLFGEHFNNEPSNVAVGCVAFLSMAVGVVLISRTSPPDSDPDLAQAPAERSA
jgi:hypothetical protein